MTIKALAMCAVLLVFVGPVNAKYWVSDLERSDPVDQALILTLARNMRVFPAELKCKPRRPDPVLRLLGLGDDVVRTKVILVPINHEVLTACVEFRANVEKWPADKSLKFMEQAQKKYIGGKESVFALVVVNPKKFDAHDGVRFGDIEKNIEVRTEHQSYPLIRYTPGLGEALNPGWNSGFVYFDNIRTHSSDTYTFFLRGLTIYACDGPDGTHEFSWSASFEESDLQILSLIEDGVTARRIATSSGLSETRLEGLGLRDLWDLASFIVSILAIIV